MQELLDTRQTLATQQESVDSQVERRCRQLGVPEKARLEKLLDNKYLGLLVQARALKERLRFRLQTRKFELERLDRAYQRGSHGGAWLVSFHNAYH